MIINKLANFKQMVNTVTKNDDNLIPVHWTVIKRRERHIKNYKAYKQRKIRNHSRSLSVVEMSVQLTTKY